MYTKNQPFVVEFTDTNRAQVVQLITRTRARHVAQSLHFIAPRRALFINGGAMRMSREAIEQTRAMVEDGLAIFAQERNIVVVDGGTDSGVMQLIGEVRRNRRYSFPLIGVAPMHKVKYPGFGRQDGKTLEPGHSHFVLTQGTRFGDESKMLAALTYSISGFGALPAVGVVINGGRVTRDEVCELAISWRPKVPLIILEGSGRFADDLARCVRDGDCNGDELLKRAATAGDIHLVRIADGPGALYKKLQEFYPRG